MEQEKNFQAEAFLKKLLLEDGGIYTLAGDKPITDSLIFTGTESDTCTEDLSPEALKKLKYVEDESFRNLVAWKKIAKKIKMKSFLFVERPSVHDPFHTMYILVNLPKVREILSEHKKAFSELTCINFEIDEVLKEFVDSKSVFWDRVLKNHYLCGLLHGYGEENSNYFSKIISGEVIPCFSEDFKGEITPDRFPIPIFAVGKDKSVVEKYKKQREKIRSLYRGKDFYNYTIQSLKK